MEIIHSIILGAVQGITEFLPISSSGHLVLVPYLFNWDYKGLGFDVALHFGTVIAIVAYFWKDWLSIIQNALSGVIPAKAGILPSKKIPDQVRDDSSQSYPKNLLWQIVIASIPAAIVGFLINDYVESTFHSPLLLAANLVIFGLILWLTDKYASRNLNTQNISYKQSFLVGLAQSIALIPGISRSGITMIASRGIGLKREEAARFSFLLGTPAMVGAFLLEFKDISSEIFNLPFALAVLSSAIFGFAAIKYLLQYLKKGNFSVFAVYRVALAIVVIAVYLTK